MDLAKMNRVFRLAQTSGILSACLFGLVYFICFSFPAIAQDKEGRFLEPGVEERVFVFGNASWTDTNYEVDEDQEINFRASRMISLQMGNPIAHCGPDGYNLKTMQQPLRDKNIGALIGRVIQLISIEIDEETGEETRNELIEVFYIGSSNTIRMPISGRLFLGINENVVEDNSGEYIVLFYIDEKIASRIGKK